MLHEHMQKWYPVASSPPIGQLTAQLVPSLHRTLHGDALLLLIKQSVCVCLSASVNDQELKSRAPLDCLLQNCLCLTYAAVAHIQFCQRGIDA